MSSTITQTSIANRALQLLGYKSIGSLNDTDRGARAINRAYPSVFLNLLRSNYWSFAIKRAILPASSVPPIFGMANYFPLPSDYVMLAPPDQIDTTTYGAVPQTPNISTGINDWQIENANGTLAIASNENGPLYVRYISSAVSESLFDPCFAEALSAALALETCEELTQSNTKMAAIKDLFSQSMDLANKRNAFENKPVQPPVDPYILVRM